MIFILNQNLSKNTKNIFKTRADTLIIIGIKAAKNRRPLMIIIGSLFEISQSLDTKGSKAIFFTFEKLVNFWVFFSLFSVHFSGFEEGRFKVKNTLKTYYFNKNGSFLHFYGLFLVFIHQKRFISIIWRIFKTSFLPNFYNYFPY